LAVVVTLIALMSGLSLTAAELAREAGVTPSTASGHLAKLAGGGAAGHARCRVSRRHLRRCAIETELKKMQKEINILQIEAPRLMAELNADSKAEIASACRTEP
jgi:DNA-binding MarR family transcriptional regulator